MSNENLPATTGNALALKPAFSIDEARERYGLMRQFVGEIMVEGKDYGTIPGTAKDTLYKPGAEKLASLFALSTKIVGQDVVEDWEGKDHGGEPFFYYLYRLGLFRGDRLIAEAEGSANSRENRYRWRWVNEDEVPPHLDKKPLVKRGGRIREMGFAVDKAETTGKYGKPAEYWQRFQDAIAKGEATKVEITTASGKTYPGWEIDSTQYRTPNEDIFSLVNTIQKIAYKRAFVAVTLVGCNASDYFSQDLEDLAEDGVIDGEFRVVTKETGPKQEQKNQTPPKQAPQQEPQQDKPVTINWGTFWRELGALNITTKSMLGLLGTNNPTEYAKTHGPEHAAAIIGLVQYAASIDLPLAKFCEILGASSLAAWVGDEPESAMEGAQDAVSTAMQKGGETEQETML